MLVALKAQWWQSRVPDRPVSLKFRIKKPEKNASK
jgi:hypothetical protein